MALNLFGPPTKDDIKVAYIDPILGLVEGVSIPEANEYAKREPGTTFIFRNGNQTLQYLNVNEINNLDPNVLIKTDECGGVSQKKECGPPTIQIFGGGGIGAAGNPIVGNDGSILAVDIIRGGNGYQYPPLVSARDICNYGSGATFTTIIGEVVETTETYDNEADFENYELGDPTDVGYGQNWGPDGEDLGSWDPKVYTNPGEDPINKEVIKFQEIVRKLARTPFWTTRKNKPTKITCSDLRVIPSRYDVIFPTWNEFMNSYAISPTSPSNVRGSDFGGRVFTFEWTEEFPTDGEYIFRGLCDNNAQLYINNSKIADLAGFDAPVRPIQKTFKKGIYTIRVDLLNEITTTQLPVFTTQLPVVQNTNIIDVNFNISTNGGATFTHNFKVNELGIDVFKPTQTALNQNIISKCESGKVYEVEFFVNGSPGGLISIANNGLRIEVEDGGGENPVDASVNISQGKFLNARGNKCSFVVGELKSSEAQVEKTTDVDFNIKAFGDYSSTFEIKDLEISITKPVFSQIGQAFSNKVQVGKVYNIEINVPQSRDGVRLEIKGQLLEMEEEKSSSPRDLFLTISKGRFFDIQNGVSGATCKFVVDENNTTQIVESVVSVVSSKSWNDNPMGVSVTIDAPEPSIPQEPIPEQEGRCPNNPIWSTRFPGAKEFWYPVRYSEALRANGIIEWSSFLSRYAISPIKPLDTPGSDGGGVVFTNSWSLEIPYDGFYQFAVQRDDTARLYVDGNLAFDVKTSGDARWVDFRNKPKFQKVFITKGRHTIGVELENKKTEAFNQVNQKIFRTKDWQVSASQVEKTTDVDVDFDIKAFGDYSSTFEIKDLGINITKPIFSQIAQSFSNKVQVGKVYNIEINVPQSRDGVRLERKEKLLEMEEEKSSSPRDLFLTISKGRFFDIQNGVNGATCKFVVDEGETDTNLEGLSGGTSKDGVTYEGPPLFAYKNNQWGKFMNSDSVSPLLPPLNVENPEINGIKKYNWKGVNFPESGQYDVVFQADNNADLIIGGVKVLTSQGFAENSQIFKVNITQGKYDITVECNNIPDRTSIFTNNPTGFALVISKNISVLREGSGKSWEENPICISAILIPPPCPRRIRGKGIVTDIIVNDPGNGYLPPISPTTTPSSALELIQTDIPGVPGSGAGAGAGDGLGDIGDIGGIGDGGIGGGVGVGTGIGGGVGGGTGIGGGVGGGIGGGIGDGGVGGIGGVGPGGNVPLSIPSPPSGAPTGINASFRPQFEVVRDPIVVNSQKLLQVTDLVGLKQTGYVNGRAYYGSVYYDKGIRYAGFYETIGEPIRVYDTLRESIIAQLITPPSAILRQGTDIRSNNPLLNIPGTVQSTLSSNSIVGAGDYFPPSVPFIQEPVKDPIYPVSLRLKRVLVEDPGINYNVTDQIRVIPSNGAVLEPIFGSFGRVIKVAVIDPGFGFTEYPRIEMFTPL